MASCCKRRLLKRFFYLVISLVGLVAIILFFIVPLVFRNFPSLMRNSIFVPNEEVPLYNDYKHPENYGFSRARNFYLTTEDGAMIGVWHILPTDARELNASLVEDKGVDQSYDELMVNGTVFLYLHGSAGTRCSPHRLRVYRMLNSLGYHVVTYDYRGYGDSTSSVSNETDLTKDTVQVYLWIKERVQSNNIFIWGHSLGTGIAALASDYVYSQMDDKETIKGIVLESPFNNMASAVRESSLLQMFSFLPWFEYCFIQPLWLNGLSFESDKHLSNISTPVLILHAKDDTILPYRFASQLYEEVVASRKDASTVSIIGYNSSLGYGHYNIPTDTNIGNITRSFVEKYET